MADALRFRRDLNEPFPAPVWPDGVAPVLFSQTMAEELHALLCEGYAKGEGDVPPFAAWSSGLFSDPEYDAELIFVAEADDGRLVGLAQCWNSGFLKDLVVAPGWRRQGLGEALLLRVFEALKNRYHTQLDLKVKSSNLAAIRLYKRLGMVAVTQD